MTSARSLPPTTRCPTTTFARAKRILGEQQVVDLVAVSGTYVTAAMLLSVAEAMPPEGAELPFKPGEL